MSLKSNYSADMLNSYSYRIQLYLLLFVNKYRLSHRILLFLHQISNV